MHRHGRSLFNSSINQKRDGMRAIRAKASTNPPRSRSNPTTTQGRQASKKGLWAVRRLLLDRHPSSTCLPDPPSSDGQRRAKGKQWHSPHTQRKTSRNGHGKSGWPFSISKWAFAQLLFLLCLRLEKKRKGAAAGSIHCGNSYSNAGRIDRRPLKRPSPSQTS